MTMGWHMVLQFSPARFGCYIWDGNHSFEMIRNAKAFFPNVLDEGGSTPAARTGL